MKSSPLFWIAPVLIGFAMVLYGVPGSILLAIFFFAFLSMIITYYRSAIRQGHSGLVFLPLKKGPFGYDGLKLKMNEAESRVVVGSAFLIAGMLVGVVFTIATA